MKKKLANIFFMQRDYYVGSKLSKIKPKEKYGNFIQ